MEFLNELPGTAVLMLFALGAAVVLVVAIGVAFVAAVAYPALAGAGLVLLILEIWHDGLMPYALGLLALAFFGKVFEQMSLR